MSIEIEHRTSNHIITKMQHGNAPQMMENLKGLNSGLLKGSSWESRKEAMKVLSSGYGRERLMASCLAPKTEQTRVSCLECLTGWMTGVNWVEPSL
jgi:hypothetical protein